MTEAARFDAPGDGNEPQKPVQLDSLSDLNDLTTAHDLVLLEIFTSGCGICGSMEPVLGTVARVAPGVVAMANAGVAPAIATEFTIQSVPTLVVLKDGEEVARLDDGFERAETLIDLLETHATK